jgi:hypothetical protein
LLLALALAPALLLLLLLLLGGRQGRCCRGIGSRV